MVREIKRTNLRRKSCMVRFLHGGINSIFPENVKEKLGAADKKSVTTDNVINIKNYQ